MGEKLGYSRGNCDSHRKHSKRNCSACEALSLPMLGVAMSQSELTAYERQSFRCGYDFTWGSGRVRLNFQEIVLAILELAFRKDANLAGLRAIDHFPEIRSICHNLSSPLAYRLDDLRLHQEIRYLCPMVSVWFSSANFLSLGALPAGGHTSPMCLEGLHFILRQ